MTVAHAGDALFYTPFLVAGQAARGLEEVIIVLDKDGKFLMRKAHYANPETALQQTQEMIAGLK